MSELNNQQMLFIGNELIAAVKNIFPQHAEFESRYSSWAFESTIFWKLNNSANRPNKPSRIILIIIPKEAIMDANYEQRKLAVHEQFKKYIQSRYDKFNPNHEEAPDQAPPVEKWLITHDILCV